MLQKTPDAQAEGRRARILDAAARCFVRTGFHRATMQEVAAEAGMSPGNLYRYFPSKAAIVEGLAERDRKELAEDFSVFDGGGDFMATFGELGRKHFEQEPRDKAILCLQIWAEAAQNPAFAEIAAGFERDIRQRLFALLSAAQARGDIAPTADPGAVATLVSILGDGLYVRRAILPDFDPEQEVSTVMRLICSLVGDVPFSASQTEPTP
jgi:TetR/AcrR family transcriptional repressor of uid operon